MQARQKRTQKQGPYKAGQTMKAKVVAGMIEAAIRGEMSGRGKLLSRIDCYLSLSEASFSGRKLWTLRVPASQR